MSKSALSIPANLLNYQIKSDIGKDKIIEISDDEEEFMDSNDLPVTDEWELD